MTRRVHITAIAILAALLVTMTWTAVGQDSLEHLEKTEPDHMFAWVSIGNECPGSEETYNNIVEGELVRARITRTTGNWPPDGELHLYSYLNCLDSAEGRITVYHLTVRFSRAFDQEAYPSAIVYFAPNYGYLGVAPMDEARTIILDAMRNGVNRAITDYLKANFSELNAP